MDEDGFLIESKEENESKVYVYFKQLANADRSVPHAIILIGCVILSVVYAFIAIMLRLTNAASNFYIGVVWGIALGFLLWGIIMIFQPRLCGREAQRN